MAFYHNVLGKSVSGGTANTTELIAPESELIPKSINIANVHASAAATVTLFLQDDPISGTTSTYHFFKEVSIPAKTSLLLDESALAIYQGIFGLYITVGSSDTVDVIISK